jgi:acylphosphatase
MQIVARSVCVTGRVQGVSFRAWTQDEAERLRVSGWVRNCPDGSVEAHVEGKQDAVEHLINLLSDGPPSARVADLHVKDAALESLSGFQIRN